ncbi:hypothetical protein LJC63_06305 [Ruminococcaceae bacterium OttesenSCG-928-L11]|nr:hypothetical protein [Ruminococcaceae bacterium OttesenSCG-928-L11]
MDSAYEQPESGRGGNNPERADLQLNTEDSETPSLEGGVSAFPIEITEDEINAYLTRGSHTADSKYRIFSFFLHEHSAKEKADFLKDEYGYGGGSYDFADGTSGHYNASPSSGISLDKGNISAPVAEVKLTWTNAANRIDRLINDGKYMSQQELDHLPSFERQRLGAHIQRFFADLPDEIERPAGITSAMFGDFWGEATRIGDTLDNPETLAAVLAAMRPVMENTPEGDRYYDTRKEAFDNLTAFENGMFTLFPQLGAVQTAIDAPTETVQTPPAQLTLFPTESEQMALIHEAEQLSLAATPVSITQEDIDNLLADALSDSERAQIQEQFAKSPRSREAVELIKQIYISVAYTTERPDGQPGYMGALGEKDGLNAVIGDASTIPLAERKPLATETLSWAKVHRRVAELVQAGRFITPEVLEQPEQEQMTDVAVITDTEQAVIELAPRQPPPVFFVDWNTAQHDFDLSRYNDRAVVGYDKDGVEYTVGKSGNLTYITGTGMLMGGNSVPGNIYEQLHAYLDGEVTEEQVRENYLKIILHEPPQITAPETTAPAYAIGDTVFLEDDRQFIIDGITDREVKLLDPNLYIPITRSMDIADFEREFANNPKNAIETPVEVAAPTVHEAEPIPEAPAAEQSRPANFRISDTHLGEGGAKTKYGYNITALKLLGEIEADGRSATPTEQEVLSRYVGWGGLPQAFDPDNKQWEKEYAELSALLTPEEYESARASTLNAHYTSPIVISAMYETLERLGVKDGNILEPACGVGNFFGLLPDSMKNAKLYGVELDSVTGRIAKQLYPDANIQIKGFEKTDTPDAFFDVAVGNVPFGSYKVADKRYDKHNFLIHDYFFAKTLDQVRPGGIVAFITSKGTLDKANPEVRKYLAQRAELLGAVRLPNNAFLKNAGTEVTSDIIFLQKRDRLIDIQPDWVYQGQTEDGIPVNSYFADNPHMMLGTMDYDDRMYGNNSETTCNPIEGADLAEQLKSALSHIQGKITENELDDLEGVQDISISADPSVRNFSYTLVDDIVYFRENSRMYPVEMPAATLERVKGMTEMRDTVHTLIDYQLYDYPDSDIRAKQAQLGELHDRFTKKFGLVNDSANSRAFSADSSYYLLCSLEVLDENGKLERKSDMFTKRTVKREAVISSVDTAAEALAVSIGKKARVDMGYMMELTGFTEEKIADDLRGVIFRDVSGIDAESVAFAFYDLDKRPYVTADEYLSGDVRQKLRLAERLADKRPDLAEPLAINITALKQAQPKDLDASEISVRLGSTWIDKAYIQEFMYELLETPYYLRDDVIKVNYSEYTGEWNITGKNRASYSDVLANVTYGTSRMPAYRIIEDTLNLKDVRVYDTMVDNDGKERRVLNKKETTLAAQKQDALKQAFKDWIFRDPDRRQNLVAVYNERFNSTRVREYDGAHIEFGGISPEIKLKPHQTGAIARILYGGNTLLAHEVGAGKTFEMVGAAMESKRLGLCNKSLMAVPNHLTEQMASEFLRLYPSANILVATKKDFETKNRKKFCAKIATGDYDSVIIGHSQLEKIPLSKERQERLLDEQIEEITQGIDELKRNSGERFTIKQLEKTKKSLEARLDKLTDDSRKDDVVTFEQLGVDRLFVDESHNFKNLFLYTKMRNVAGLSQTEAQKSSDMFMKCRYMDEITGGKGVIFATGTPVSNSMTELYTVQRYLQFDTLQKNRMAHFDAWASTFGETQTAIELAPEGTGYRARTRFAKFQNLPELMNMFCEVADIKTADTLDLERPDAHFHTVVVKPTEIQKEMVAELSERAAAVHNKEVEPEQDNMLKITSDGRKIGLDQRLMNPMLPDDPASKVNACMENIYNIWEDSAEKRLTQLCFCDFSTPNKDGRFNVYDDIKGKLIAKGIPEDEIAFIHDANTETQKKELFAKVRSGKVRVLFGSTFKCGAGTNVQDRLVALHDLDCPWRPADLAQRAGRIVRQGNQNAEVNIYRYVTESTFDAYLFQTVEKKQQFISQIMTSKSPVRSCDDVDEESLSYAEIKALCAGNPAIKEKMNLDIEVSKLKLLKSEHQSQRYRLQDDLLQNFPKRIEAAKVHIVNFKADIERLETHTHRSEESISPMTIGDKTYTDRGKAGAALLEACKEIKTTEPVKIGSYRGFDMLISFDSLHKTFHIDMKGNMAHGADLGDDSYGNITRINNAFDKIPQRLQSVEAQLQTLYSQVENAKAELERPFPLEAELAEKSERLSELDAMLNMDEHGDSEQEQEAAITDVAVKHEPVAASAKEKPSVLETLKSNAEKSRQLFGVSVNTDKSAEISI